MGSMAWRKSSVDVALEPLGMRWRDIFERCDLDKDGKIYINEFIELLKNENNIPHRVIQDLQQSVRQGDRPIITYPEFVKLINDRKPRNLFQHAFLQYIKYVIPPRSNKIIDHTDGEYEDEYTCDPPAVCMFLVSIIEIIIFLIDTFKKMPISQAGPIATLLWYNPHRRAEAWRFFTYMFVHIGSFHLLVNVVVQLILGVPLEMVHRWWRVLLVYLAGVLAGSLGTSISDPNVYLAGASGGVYALITAHVATIIMNWSEMKFALWQLLIFLMIIMADTGQAIYSRYNDEDNKIGYAAHLAGAVAGLLVGLYILRNLEVHSWEKKASRLAAIVYLILLIASIVFNLINSNYFPYQDKDILGFGNSDKDDNNNNN